MIRRDSLVKTMVGIAGVVEDVIPHFSSHHDERLDTVYLKGHTLPYLRWQLSEIEVVEAVKEQPNVSKPVQKLMLRFNVPGMPHICQYVEAEVIGEPLRVTEQPVVLHAKGVTTTEANDYFVMVKFKRSGSIDWCNLNTTGKPEYQGLGTLAEAKAFLRNTSRVDGDQFFVFKLSDWKYCT